MTHFPPALSPRRLASAVALLALGFFGGRLTLPPVAPATPPATALSARASAPLVSDGSALVAASVDTSGEKISPSSLDPKARWAELRGQSPSAARERALAECLRFLAATDPQGALALAREEVNVRVRQDLVVASLEGWAGHDPAASLAWATGNLFEANRRQAVEAIVTAGLPLREETMQAVRALCETTDAATADDYGRMLIAALARDADFPNALRFATEGPAERRDYWTGAALYSWSQYRPAEAAAALEAITDPATRNEGMHGLILGWSANDPVSLLKYAQALPPGPARGEAFNQALQNWVAHDPVAASAWLDTHESTPELDSGAVKLATSPFLVENNVETALSWAHGVSDPEQRSIALVDVIQQWAKRDPAAARAYADTLPDLQPSYREQLMQSLAVTLASAPATVAPKR